MYIRWKKQLFEINEIYGPSEESTAHPSADMFAYFQQNAPVAPSHWNAIHKQALTLCIDLKKSEEQLKSELNKSTRYQINKAGRDELAVQIIDDPGKGDLETFKLFFNPYAKEKGIEPFQDERIESIQAKGMVTITYVYHKNGQRLAGHLYFADGARARMFYSCSERFADNGVPKNEIGRANRYLHWMDILYFKKKNYEVYDFFGLSLDERNSDQQNINQFKKSFGGEEIIEYRSFIPKSLKGNLLILLLKLKWRNQPELIRK
ncbi:peptidoglycan bridge formation glycyltransferase FemA/FemB family protein [Bacillus sp. FJAT-27245]|uniref:peptidoglycan bridge formation glycyltransferase FemA/FemB family protein n=1 Tax=Bacillus sp. FJAT-27245 TaxID=1684144 RepID=UPI0006A7AF88|nr:peptidoglycan bridge formation glycyltransferase FemA/FemB family protein [Bacillus sp. FJAT-27245]